MPSYTNTQFDFTVSRLGMIGEMAKRLLPGRSLTIASQATGKLTSSKDYRLHRLILKPQGLFHTEQDAVGKEIASTKISNETMCTGVVELFELGPEDVVRALGKLADPCIQDEDQP